MTDDDPVDLDSVAADDAALEALRIGAAAPEDSALALLRDLLGDVESDLPELLVEPTPVGVGSTVLRLAGEGSSPERRVARSAGVVALLTAGAVSLGGVAAASTVVPEGNPLRGLGDALRSAAGAVVSAVTPPEAPHGGSAGRTAGSSAVVPTTRPTALPGAASATARAVRPTAAPGPSVAPAARAQAAVRRVVALLDAAEQLLADGRLEAAEARLDTAERHLRALAPADRPPLQSRLTRLRERLEAAGSGAAGPGTRPERAEPAPDREPAGQGKRRAEGPKSRPSRTAPAPPERGHGAVVTRSGPQSAKDASAKPRA